MIILRKNEKARVKRIYCPFLCSFLYLDFIFNKGLQGLKAPSSGLKGSLFFYSEFLGKGSKEPGIHDRVTSTALIDSLAQLR